MASYRSFKTAIIPSGAMTGTETITSQVFDVQSLEGAAFQPTWTGTPTGTLIVQVSLDYVPAAGSNNGSGTPINAGTWTNLGASIPQNPAGSAGNTYIPIYASCADYIRLSYTNESGSGVLGGMFIGKTRG